MEADHLHLKNIDAQLQRLPRVQVPDLLKSLDMMPVLVAYVDRQLNYRYVSRPYRRRIQYRSEEILGNSYKKIVGRKKFQQAGPYLKSVLIGNIVQFTQHRYTRKKRKLLFDVILIPCFDEHGKNAGFYECLSELTTSKSAESTAELKYKDNLTGLLNRTALHEKLDQIIEQMNSGQRQYFIHFNLNRFSHFNESFGHVIGDQILREVSLRLTQLTEGANRVFRLGGDEFGVIMTSPESQQPKAADLIDTLTQLLTPPITINDVQVRITITAGIARFNHKSKNSNEIIRHADIALRDAKSNNKPYSHFNKAMKKNSLKELRLETELFHALNDQQIETWLQPLIQIQTREIIGYEALARWRKENGEMVSPGSFIPVAENTGLIIRLGELILVKAIKSIRQLHRQGMQTPPYISVNVSPLQLMSANYIEHLETIVTRLDFDRRQLLLEVTEEVAADNNRQMLHVAQVLRDRGFRIACDDFGAGYSSLSRLRDMPWDYIKIDRTFLANDENMPLLGPITQMVQNLNIPLIIEGVETEEQNDKIKALGCTLAQGYLYGKPSPVDQLITRHNDSH